MSTNIQPLGDRILVKQSEDKEQIKGGIIIPDSAKEKSQEASVIAVGPGKRNDKGERTPVDVNVGDRVLISKYGGTEVKLNDQSLLLVRQDDLLAVFK